jgi:hypothetical protein
MNGGVRTVARKLLWPARRFFDPRFTGVVEQIDDVKRLIAADAAAANEFATFTGRSFDQVNARLEQLDERLEQLSQRVAFDPDATPSVDEIDENTARVLNYGSSHEGFAAQANLWFNPSLLVGYGPGRVELQWVNERIVEVPRAFSRPATCESAGCRSDREHDVPFARDPRVRRDRCRSQAEPALARAASSGRRADRAVGARRGIRRGSLPVDGRAHWYGRV